jgi:sugar phosphate isomerase/epimerase
MRLGAPLLQKFDDPAAWVAALGAKGYRAAYCPLGPGATDTDARAFAAAAETADVVIAEVGAWSNPLSPDPAKAREAREKCKACLDLADRVGARSCVNIAGSRGAKWDGPCPADLEEETFDMVVEVVREIIDAVKPKRSCYALETMPWMHPNSADAYLRLAAAIDRKALGVHFDPVNLVVSPEVFFRNGAMIRDFVAKLGPRIRSCHAKDIALGDRLTVHLDEVRPGLGGLDYRAFLRALDGLDPDLTVMLEHLPGAGEYDAAAAHVRKVAAGEGIRC